MSPTNQHLQTKYAVAYKPAPAGINLLDLSKVSRLTYSMEGIFTGNVIFEGFFFAVEWYLL